VAVPTGGRHCAGPGVAAFAQLPAQASRCQRKAVPGSGAAAQQRGIGEQAGFAGRVRFPARSSHLRSCCQMVWRDRAST